MIYRDFARTGFKTSVIGMGTYYDPFWIFLAMAFRSQRNRKTKLEALRAGLDAGNNFIDTAELYRSETIVADAISGRKRDEIFLASKVWSNHLHRDSLMKACSKSLERLKTSYLDLYQVHFPNSRVPIKETMEGMEELVLQGKVKAIGVSNFSLKQTKEAVEALSKHELASTQLNYSLVHRDIERDILPYCVSENIAVIAYYPLGHGKLAKDNKVFGAVSKGRGWQPAQIALSWLFSKSKNIFPIPRASRAEHVLLDSEAGNNLLSEEELALLDRSFA